MQENPIFEVSKSKGKICRYYFTEDHRRYFQTIIKKKNPFKKLEWIAITMQCKTSMIIGQEFTEGPNVTSKFPLGITNLQRMYRMKHTLLFTWNLASWEEQTRDLWYVKSVFFQKKNFFSQQTLRNLIPVKLNHLDYIAFDIKFPIKTTLSTVKTKK